MTSFCQADERRRRLRRVAWLIGLALCLAPAYAEQPHFTPALFDSTQQPAPSEGYSLDAGATNSDAASNPLLGYWEYRGAHGTITLLVKSNTRIVISGHEMNYELRPGFIHITDEDGSFDYPYQLANDRLILRTVDGESAARDISFRRVKLTEPGAGYLPEIGSYR